MKKILFSLLMLCSITAAWAGDGDGSKDHPYSGEQNATELKSKLKVGDYLAYDCIINDGVVTVYDDSLMVRIVHGWSTWAVGDPIDDTPFAIYNVGSDYCSIYSPEDRKSHLFEITGFIELKPEEDHDDKIAITGHYSGKYISGDGSHDVSNKSSVYVEDSINKIRVHTAQEFKDSVMRYGKDPNAIIQIMNDIDMAGFEHLTEPDDSQSAYTFKAQLCGYHNRRYEDGEFVRDKNDNILVDKFELKNLDYFLFGKCEEAKVQGIILRDADMSSKLSYRSNLICHTATKTEFTDITVFGCRYNDEFFLKYLPFGLGWIIDKAVGSYAGQVATKMEDCKVKGVYVIGSSLFIPGSGVGNIAGYAKNTSFEDCFADAGSTVYVQSDTNANAGGLVGESENCTFTDCVNISTVCGSEKADNVGGICGLSTDCTFERCHNGGVLAQTQMETWISATLANNYALLSSIKTIAGLHPIEGCKEIIKDIQIANSNFCNTTSAELLLEKVEESAIAEVGKDVFTQLDQVIAGFFIAQAIYTVTFNLVVALNDPDEIGGISSAAYGCTFNNCMNAGRIFCRDAYAGGIVGRAYSSHSRKTSLNKCINIGYVQGTEQTGGIVGCMEDDGEILNCLNTCTIDSKDTDSSGPIYGEKTGGTTVRNCFALTHGAKDHTDGFDGNSQITQVSYSDVLSGLVACELNKRSNSKDFCQIVGKQLYPTFFDSKEVNPEDVSKDVDAVYKVADLNGFVNAIFNQYADIELLNDIDFKGRYFSVYRKETPFRGSIDGKGHSLTNIRINGADLGSDASKDYAILGAAEGATFKDLSLNKCSIEFPRRGAGLVCESTGCKYENVHLVNGTAITAKGAGVGGFIYLSQRDSLINCSVGDDCAITGGYTVHYNTSDVGGFAYKAVRSAFTDCYNKGKVTGEFGYVGGIVAICEEQSSFTHCVIDKTAAIEIQDNKKYFPDNSAFATHGKYGAGIAAKATNSWFNKCANYGKINAPYDYAGGIVGSGDDVTIHNCLNSTPSGYLSFGNANNNTGSIIGEAKNHSRVSNCAANKDGKYSMIGDWSDMQRTAGRNYMLGGLGSQAGQWEMGVTQAEFDSGKVCYWLNEGKEDGSWHQNGSELTLDDGAPVTLSDLVNENRSDVFTIYTPMHLREFAEYVNSGHQFADAILMNDINMAGEEFTPIGMNENHKHFRGIIDGRGHTIDSLKVQSDKPVGLIGAAHAHAEVHNLIIGKGSEFVNTGGNGGLGDEGAGAIIGRVATEWRWGDVRIKNCGSYANIKVNRNGGGIFGRLNDHDDNYDVGVWIENCFSMGTVTARDGNSALLGGYMKSQGYVTNCWSGGQLRTTRSNVKPFSTENEWGHWELLVGFNKMINITNCYVIDPLHNVDLWDKNHYQGAVDTLTTTDLASGKLAYLLNDSINDVSKQLVWEQNLGTDGNPTFGNKGIYHTRKVTNQYGTLCLPYYLRSNDKISFYYIAKNDIKENLVTLKFKYIDEVPPGHPILFRIKDYDETTDSELLFNWDGSNGFESTPRSYSGYWYWNMFGTYEKTVLDETTYYPSSEVYYLSNGEIRNAKKTTIAPFRSFFWLPDVKRLFPDYYDSVAIQFILEDEDGTTTAIELVGDDFKPVQNGKSYSIMGTEVGDSYRGIVIKNGKKVLKK